MIKIRLYEEEYRFDVVREGDVVRVLLEVGEGGSRGAGGQRVWIDQRDGRLLVLEVEQLDGSRRRLQVVGSADGQERQVWVNGRLFSYERVRPQSQRAAAGDGSLAASIPAVVSQILVSPGDDVRAGDKLILLESMKMVIPIQAPYDGRVRQLNCAVGDSVAAGAQLLELEAGR
jgi:biotin carboxyl carrier protein